MDGLILTTPHILETALLMLAVFLVGCGLGLGARLLVAAGRKPAAVTVAQPAPAVADLVIAPRIAPLAPPPPRHPSPAQRLAAAATHNEDPAIAPPVVAPIVEPAVPTMPDEDAAAASPAVLPESAEGPVRAEDVPPIDEAAHVLDPEAEPIAPPNEEAAAMLAIEGSWSPPSRRPGDAAARVEAPEGVAELTPEPEPPAAAESTPPDAEPPHDVETAMTTARSAVAAATAAAEAAIATPVLDFEVHSDAPRQSFLVGDAPHQDDAQGELDFGGPKQHMSFGRPEALPAPLAGGKDNLRQIKGITPALEASLNGLGIYHFHQIAGWDQKAVVWMDNHLALKGRITRDKWQDQARQLARGRPAPARPVRR